MEAEPNTETLSDLRGLSAHPYYRIPPREAGNPFFTFDGLACLKSSVDFSTLQYDVLPSLSVIRETFAKRRLSIHDVENLLRIAKELLNYASSWDYNVFGLDMKPAYVVARLSRLFLITDALWAVSEAVGAPMKRETWWGAFMDKLPSPQLLAYTLRPSKPGKASFIHRVSRALEVYRMGKRPSVEEVVGIKRNIFKLPCININFRRPAWDPWRRDDELFEEADE